MYGSLIAAEIMSDMRRKNTKFLNFKSNIKNKEWLPCICLICGEHLDCLTKYHAEKHGYKNKAAIIKAKKIKWINKNKKITKMSFLPPKYEI